VWKHYKEHGRNTLPWRHTRDPYKILVSEVMLQQTQVDRVIPKYKSFLKKFPTVEHLSAASIRAVLVEWQGLGYNRRALNLKRAAEEITKVHKDTFPRTFEELIKLPGVGRATAGDIVAFAYNKPAVVIETNIRTVFIHHFFNDRENISDKELERLIKETLPSRLPDGAPAPYRDWYYALMDYGSHLKKTAGNSGNKSTHYRKQSAFKGSNREVRSKILKLILDRPRTKADILKLLDSPAPAIERNLIALSKEGLIRKSGAKFTS
jgi:A/G-specific adenine glycosylase